MFYKYLFAIIIIAVLNVSCGGGNATKERVPVQHGVGPSISLITLTNETEQGEILGTGKSYSASDIRYIAWKVDYTDNQSFSSAKVYIRYVRFVDNEYVTFKPQGDFTERDGTLSTYTQVQNMTYNAGEQYTIKSRLGSASGGDFQAGRWGVLLYLEDVKTGKNNNIGVQYFEIY